MVGGNPKEQAQFTVFDPSGHIYFEKTTLPNGDGTVATIFPTNSTIPIGNWTAVLKYKSLTANTSFAVLDPKDRMLIPKQVNPASNVKPSVILGEQYNAGDIIIMNLSAPNSNNVTVRVLDPVGNAYLSSLIRTDNDGSSVNYPVHISKFAREGNWSVEVISDNFNVQRKGFKITSGEVVPNDLPSKLEAMINSTGGKNTIISMKGIADSNISSFLIRLKGGAIESIKAEGWNITMTDKRSAILNSAVPIRENQTVNVRLTTSSPNQLTSSVHSLIYSEGLEVGPMVIIPLDRAPPGDVRVNIVFNGNGSGWINMGKTCNSSDRSCTSFFPRGDLLSIAAWPDEDSGFTEWGGDCNSSNGSITSIEELPVSSYSLYRTMLDGNINCTVTFIHHHLRLPLTVNIEGDGIGAVYSNTIQGVRGIKCGTQGTGFCSDIFRQGWHVNLVAFPASESTFQGWGGDDCSSTSRSITVSINTAKTCIARFEPSAGANPPPQRPLVAPEFIRMSSVLASEGFELGWPVTEDEVRSATSHFQLFELQAYPSKIQQRCTEIRME